jgi:hypothetical protein
MGGPLFPAHHSPIGIKQRQFTRRAKVTDHEGTLPDPPQSLTHIQIWQLAYLG